MPRLHFNVGEKLGKNLKFWIDIYTKYYTYQGFIHDSKYIDHIYETLDLRNRDQKSDKTVRTAKKNWKAVLLSVHKKQNDLKKMTVEELLIYQIYQDVQESNKFLNATHRKRLRFQLGQKDRFLDGLYQSGKYLALMEDIFAKEGLPVELTRLPLVESSFNLKARSKVGASGIWQFMKSTGKLYLKINDWVDERNDPIRATYAAAKLLRLNYESLGNWPLAVTAYNHGRKGLMRAVRKVGSEDLDEIVTEYRSRRFGFASSNFFTELLAAVEVEKNAEKYFPQFKRAAPLSFFEVKVPDALNFKEFVKALGLDFEKMADLNPAFTEKVFSGKKKIPPLYSLRLPLPMGQEVSQALKEFESLYKSKYGRGVATEGP